MGDVKAPNCPTCGEFMDKVKVEVKEQLSEGKTPVGAVVIAWACANCNKIEG